ncbi:helix-turn-helix domain-containing protein [Stenotrophomonas sp. GbtcB23]|uniref:winged helix-turn-helix transcriptional regulator n=1 Tax=Stenotrophomonas sp. GbtcB23 TaxID=2824768 RepID=UPI001C2F3B9D
MLRVISKIANEFTRPVGDPVTIRSPGRWPDTARSAAQASEAQFTSAHRTFPDVYRRRGRQGIQQRLGVVDIGLRRFSDFQRGLGMSRSMLSQRLQALQDAGVLTQQAAADSSRYLDYVLTAQGQALFPLVVALRQWGEGHLFDPSEPRSHLQVIGTGQAVAPLLPRDAEGRARTAAETEVIKPDSLP